MKSESPNLKNDVDVEKGRHKSIKRLLHEYDRENVKYIYIAD